MRNYHKLKEPVDSGIPEYSTDKIKFYGAVFMPEAVTFMNYRSEENRLSDSNQNQEMSVCILASGSKGNSIFVSSGASAILIDAGLSAIELERRMTSRNLLPSALKAIVISHEHTDHIQASFVISKRYKIPVYASRATLDAMGEKTRSFHETREFVCGNAFRINGMEVHPFSISHDAADPAGFTVSAGSKKMGIATDLGIATSLVKTRLMNCSFVMVEANHDPVMLASGPYPWTLKQRVRSRYGHLSNQETKELISQIIHPGLRHVVLGHLSEKNNTHEMALGTVSEAIRGRDISISSAFQHCASNVYSV